MSLEYTLVRTFLKEKEKSKNNFLRPLWGAFYITNLIPHTHLVELIYVIILSPALAST